MRQSLTYSVDFLSSKVYDNAKNDRRKGLFYPFKLNDPANNHHCSYKAKVMLRAPTINRLIGLRAKYGQARP